jgi:hypothetical protein
MDIINKKETLLSDRQTEDAIFSAVWVLQKFAWIMEEQTFSIK